MLFSDNVSLGSERALKERAHSRGLLVMGPDCGTAYIAGTPLAFANVVPPGRVGVIAASGSSSPATRVTWAIGVGPLQITKSSPASTSASSADR